MAGTHSEAGKNGVMATGVTTNGTAYIIKYTLPVAGIYELVIDGIDAAASNGKTGITVYPYITDVTRTEVKALPEVYTHKAGEPLSFTVRTFDQHTNKQNTLWNGLDTIHQDFKLVGQTTATASISAYRLTNEATEPAKYKIDVPQDTLKKMGTYKVYTNITGGNNKHATVSALVPTAIDLTITPADVSPDHALVNGSSLSLTKTSRPSAIWVQVRDRFGNPVDTADVTGLVVTFAGGKIEGQGFGDNGDVLIADGKIKFVSSTANNKVTKIAGLAATYEVMYTVAWPGEYKVSIEVLGATSNSAPPTLLSCAGGQALGLHGYTCIGSQFNMTAIKETCKGRDPSKPFECIVGSTRSCVASWQDCSGVSEPCPVDRPVVCWTMDQCMQSSNDAPECAKAHCKASYSQCDCKTSLGYSRCNHDLSCVLDLGQCAAECTAEKPFRCPDKSCEATEDDCSKYVSCPPGTVTCPFGVSCARTLDECQTQTVTCPTGKPLVCSDKKTCVARHEDCPSIETCKEGLVRCPDGSCKSSAGDCSIVDRCYAGGPAPYQCVDGSCAPSLADCPTSTTCPEDKPVLCTDGVCRADDKLCSANECGGNTIRCPDGSCKESTILCATQTSCPASHPVKCEDSSCKKEVADCPVVEECPPLADGTKTARCPDGSCASTLSACGTPTVCPASTPVMCWDRSCVASLSACPAVQSCPARFPMQCADGSCVADRASCPQDTRCAPAWPIKCLDGSCASMPELCPEASVDKGTLCPAGMVRCPQGQCAFSTGLCPRSVSCAFGTSKCWDGWVLGGFD